MTTTIQELHSHEPYHLDRIAPLQTPAGRPQLRDIPCRFLNGNGQDTILSLARGILLLDSLESTALEPRFSGRLLSELLIMVVSEVSHFKSYSEPYISVAGHLRSLFLDCEPF